MKTRNRHVLKALLSGAAVGCLVGTSAVAQVQIPHLNFQWASPNFQLGAQLHRVQRSAEDRQFFMEIQSYLQVLGFYRGGIDGAWGAGSDRALGEFLRIAGLSRLLKKSRPIIIGVWVPQQQTLSSRSLIANLEGYAQPDETGVLPTFFSSLLEIGVRKRMTSCAPQRQDTNRAA